MRLYVILAVEAPEDYNVNVPVLLSIECQAGAATNSLVFPQVKCLDPQKVYPSKFPTRMLTESFTLMV